MRQLWMVGGMILLLAACQQKNNVTENVQAASVASASDVQSNLPMYRVATDPTYPPFEFLDKQGDIIGLDMDLLNAIAENQGFRVKYEPALWDGMLEKLQTGEADIVVSAVAVSDDEDEIALLSEPYMQSHNCIVGLSQSKMTNWAKQTIVVAENEDFSETLQEDYAVKETQLNIQPTPFMGLKEIVANRANVVAADCTVLNYYIASDTFKTYQFQQQTLPEHSPDDVNLVFAISQKHPELRDKINAGLQHLKQSGRFEQIMQKWRQN